MSQLEMGKGDEMWIGGGVVVGMRESLHIQYVALPLPGGMGDPSAGERAYWLIVIIAIFNPETREKSHLNMIFNPTTVNRWVNSPASRVSHRTHISII